MGENTNSITIDIFKLNYKKLNKIGFLMSKFEKEIDKKNIYNKAKGNEIIFEVINLLNSKKRNLMKSLNNNLKVKCFADLSFLARNSCYYSVALYFIDEALKITENYLLLFHKAICLSYLIEYEKALKYYNKSIKINDKFYSSHYNKGKLLYEQENYLEAIKEIDKAIEINPNGAEFYNDKGLCLKFLNRYEDAIKEFNTAIQINNTLNENLFVPKNNPISIAHSNKGNILFGIKGEYKEAIKEFEKSLKYEKNEGVYFQKGLAYFMLDKYIEIKKVITILEKLNIKQLYQINFLKSLYYTFYKKNFKKGIYYLNEQSLNDIKKRNKIGNRYISNKVKDFETTKFKFQKEDLITFKLIEKKLYIKINDLKEEFLNNNPTIERKKHISKILGYLPLIIEIISIILKGV